MLVYFVPTLVFFGVYLSAYKLHKCIIPVYCIEENVGQYVTGYEIICYICHINNTECCKVALAINSTEKCVCAECQVLNSELRITTEHLKSCNI